MKYLLISLLFLGVAYAYVDLRFDIDACTTLPELPTPRVIDVAEPRAFDSPGFNISDVEGSVYPPNTICEWQLNLVDVDQDTLEFRFFDLTLETTNTSECAGDYVDVFDGPDDTGNNLGRFCSDFGLDSEPIITQNGSFFVRFVSDDNGIEETGFIARVGAPLDVTACQAGGQTFTAPSGVFASPDYPVAYGNDATCEYKFEAAPGEKVEISFFDFDLAQNCNDDLLTVYDGIGAGFSLPVGIYYGDMRPAVITSTGNDFNLEFETDNSQTGPGFFGYYRFVPE